MPLKAFLKHLYGKLAMPHGSLRTLDEILPVFDSNCDQVAISPQQWKDVADSFGHEFW